MSLIPALQEVEIGGSGSESVLGKKSTRLYLKDKLRAKGLSAWAQVADHLPGKCEVPNSIPVWPAGGGGGKPKKDLHSYLATVLIF
jgi:hypothetical protein